MESSASTAQLHMRVCGTVNGTIFRVSGKDWVSLQLLPWNVKARQVGRHSQTQQRGIFSTPIKIRAHGSQTFGSPCCPSTGTSSPHACVTLCKIQVI